MHELQLTFLLLLMTPPICHLIWMFHVQNLELQPRLLVDLRGFKEEKVQNNRLDQYANNLVDYNY